MLVSDCSLATNSLGDFCISESTKKTPSAKVQPNGESSSPTNAIDKIEGRIAMPIDLESINQGQRSRQEMAWRTRTSCVILDADKLKWAKYDIYEDITNIKDFSKMKKVRSTQKLIESRLTLGPTVCFKAKLLALPQRFMQPVS